MRRWRMEVGGGQVHQQGMNSHRPVGSGWIHGSKEPGLLAHWHYRPREVLSQFLTSPTQPEAPPLASTSDSSPPWGPAPELRPQSQTGLVRYQPSELPCCVSAGERLWLSELRPQPSAEEHLHPHGRPRMKWKSLLTEASVRQHRQGPSKFPSY